MNVRVALLAAIWLASGCDRVFGVHGAADASIDAEIDAEIDAGADGPCSSIRMLSDRFDVDDVKTQWPSSYATVDLTGRYLVKDNELQMYNVQPDGHVIISSPFYYDFRGQKFSFEFRDNGGIHAQSGQLVVSLDSTHSVLDPATMMPHRRHIDIYRAADRLQARAVSDTGTSVTIADLDYDPAMHKYVRIGLEGTLAIFETSSDGATWTQRGSSLYNGMDFVRVTFDTYRTQSGGDVAVFIGDIMRGVPRGEACKMNTLVDTFDASELGEQWASSALNFGGIFLDGGLLHMVVPDVRMANSTALPIVASSLPYDLKDNQLVIQVVRPLVADANKTVALATNEYGGDGMQMALNNGQLSVSVSRAGDPQPMTIYNGAYDPVAQQWWRIQNTATGTTFAVARDGIAWMVLANNTTSQPPRAGLVTIGLTSASNDPDEAQFDNVNTLP